MTNPTWGHVPSGLIDKFRSRRKHRYSDEFVMGLIGANYSLTSRVDEMEAEMTRLETEVLRLRATLGVRERQIEELRARSLL